MYWSGCNKQTASRKHPEKLGEIMKDIGWNDLGDEVERFIIKLESVVVMITSLPMSHFDQPSLSLPFSTGHSIAPR